MTIEPHATLFQLFGNHAHEKVEEVVTCRQLSLQGTESVDEALEFGDVCLTILKHDGDQKATWHGMAGAAAAHRAQDSYVITCRSSSEATTSPPTEETDVAYFPSTLAHCPSSHRLDSRNFTAAKTAGATHWRMMGS